MPFSQRKYFPIVALLLFCGLLLCTASLSAAVPSADSVAQDSTHPIFQILPKVQSNIGRFPIFYLYIFGGSLVLLAVVRLIAPSYLPELFRSVFDLKTQLNAFHEGRFGFNLINLLLDVLAIGMFSIFIDQFFLHGSLLFGWVVSFTAVAYFFKLIVIQFFANVFFGRGEALVHLLLHLLLTRVIGILLLPLLFIILYQTYADHMQLLFDLICMVGLMYGGWFIRLFVKMKSLTVSGVFYVFLYLCTIEISPVIIIIKDYIR